MEGIYTTIKNSLIRLLKEIDPSVDVFAEKIAKTRDDDQEMDIDTYYFLDIIPTGNNTVDGYFTDRSVFIDIAYHDKSEKNALYLEKTDQIDSKIRPVFQFGDRAITIDNASSKTVDHILHYSFNLSFRDCREITEEYEFMEELENQIKKGV